MKIRLSHAQSFLNKFNYSLTTIQVFPDKKLPDGKGVWPSIPGKLLATGKKGSSAVSYSGDLIDQNFKNDLVTLQKQSLGIFFMVNEGDGDVHGAEIVRNSKAVTKLKALFVDTDDGDPEKLKLFCKQLKIKPHLTVESSPGKYHVYFLLQETPISQAQLWKACQDKLSAIDPGFDASMSDVSRVLRIPGFYHLKKEPFLVQEIYSSDHALYSLQELADKFQITPSEEHTSSKFIRPVNKVTPGKRHGTLAAYLGSVSNYIQDEDVLTDCAIGFTQRAYTQPEQFLPTGKRYSEVCSIAEFTHKQRIQEELKDSLKRLDSTVDKKTFKTLPDSFYLNAPGIVGEMTRELCHYSLQPYPSFCFAAAVSFIGMLKSFYIRGSYRNTPPSDFFMCLADTGRGKDFPRSMMVRTAARLKLGDKVTQKFRSAPGFLKWFSEAQGVQVVYHDESHHFFNQLKSADQLYMAEFNPLLLEFHNSETTNNPAYRCGSVIAHAHVIPLIPYPTLNYCGFGISDGFEKAFQSESLYQGILGRFIIFRDHRDALPVSAKNKVVPAQFEFEKKLKLLKHSLAKAQHVSTLESNKRTFDIISFDDDAFKLLTEYSETTTAFINNPNSNQSLVKIKIRLVEHVNRISLMLSEKTVTLQDVQYASAIVDHHYDNIAQHVESFDKGQWNKDADEALEFMAKISKKHRRPVLIRDFMRTFKVRDFKALTGLLDALITTGKIEKVDYRKPGSTHGRKTIGYLIVDDDI